MNTSPTQAELDGSSIYIAEHRSIDVDTGVTTRAIVIGGKYGPKAVSYTLMGLSMIGIAIVYLVMSVIMNAAQRLFTLAF